MKKPLTTMPVCSWISPVSKGNEKYHYAKRTGRYYKARPWYVKP